MVGGETTPSTLVTITIIVIYLLTGTEVINSTAYDHINQYKFGTKVQNHCDNDAFCALGSFYCRTLYYAPQ